MLDSSEAKRMLLIINPVSGKKLAQRSLPEVIKLFSDGGYFVTVMATSRRGDATAFAAQYGGDFDLIVCVGGDGTLNEVVTGMVEKRVDTPLGYIPAGSTNDFATSLQISSNPVTAAEAIVAGVCLRVETPEALTKALTGWPGPGPEAIGAFFAAHSGATEKTLAALDSMVKFA